VTDTTLPSDVRSAPVPPADRSLGWDGRPRPPHLRPSITRLWPDAVDTQPESYVGPA
jgi:hypothetical protein